MPQVLLLTSSSQEGTTLLGCAKGVLSRTAALNLYPESEIHARLALAPLASHQPVEAQATSGAFSPGVVPADGCGIWRDSPSCSLVGSQM